MAKWSVIEEQYMRDNYGKRHLKLMMYELSKTKSQIEGKAYQMCLCKPSTPKKLPSNMIATGGLLTIDGCRTIHKMI